VFVEERERFMAYLAENGITSLIHYPHAMHLHECYSELGYKRGDFPVAEYIADHEVSMPIYYGMPKEYADYVIDVVNAYK